MTTTDEKKVKIGFIHNAFPVLSETFISKEMRGLMALGMDVEVYSLFWPQKGRLDVNYAEADQVHYLLNPFRPLSILASHVVCAAVSPSRYVKTLIYSVRRRETKTGFISTILKFARGERLNKEQRQDVLLHFVLTAPLARMMKKHGITFINSHFADAAASFALLCSRLQNVPFGITAHAYDIFTPQYNLHEKVSEAEFMLTCTRYNKTNLLEQRADIDGSKIHVFYHGIDAEKFKRRQSQENGIPQILTVGRLTAKKGFDVLLQACAKLRDKGVDFTCRIIGDGEEKESLARLSSDLELESNIEFIGAVPTSEIKDYYERAHLFVLPCVIDKDGNRDGIPNVIAEAMAMELPVVSSKISGIPELVEDSETGFLLEQHDVAGVAAAMERLINDPELSRSMGKKGRKRVLSIFDSRVCLENLYTFYMNELSNGD